MGATWMEGYRWYVVFALGLASLFVAPFGYLPWLHADKVLIGQTERLGLLALLVGFVILSFVLTSCLHGVWERVLRFGMAMIQGYIVGNVIVFDTSTLLARFGFAIALGVASACDRLAAVAAKHDAVQRAPKKLAVGAHGFHQIRGRDYAVDITAITEKALKIAYTDKPFWINTATIAADDAAFKLASYPEDVLAGILSQEQLPSFNLRPWGYAFGVCISQWMLAGFDRSDAFVSGVLTGQLSIIAVTPFTFLAVWFVGWKTSNPTVRLACFVIFCGLCLLSIVTFPAMFLGVASFAVTQAVRHQVVAFIAVPVDMLMFLAATKPTAERLSESLLRRMTYDACWFLSIAPDRRVEVQQAVAFVGTSPKPLKQS
eukprot:TRINITY_DN75151_c0_g1_i1.p1 TRINITY_DN75151_c0_g1~~TRINITY_DN75151_c0_g1_i1.p1  ORF type:complete len:373 (+),score=48.60 TRINITY_DN75151_c0_g1_i1:111-1229(+)